MTKPLCRKCDERHYNFQKCAFWEPPEPVVEEAPTEPVPPQSLKTWGRPQQDPKGFGPPVN